MDLLKGELGSSNEACVTSTVDGNEVTGKGAERVLDMTEVNDKPSTIPVIKTEPNVSYVPVVSVMYIAYRVYTELLILVNKKFHARDCISSRIEENLNFVTHTM
jgi:hypothetical protein